VGNGWWMLGGGLQANTRKLLVWWLLWSAKQLGRSGSTTGVLYGNLFGVLHSMKDTAMFKVESCVWLLDRYLIVVGR
jgi:hypothetical protein